MVGLTLVLHKERDRAPCAERARRCSEVLPEWTNGAIRVLQLALICVSLSLALKIIRPLEVRNPGSPAHVVVSV